MVDVSVLVNFIVIIIVIVIDSLGPLVWVESSAWDEMGRTVARGYFGSPSIMIVDGY
jgi:hypothetical protein